ncbi:Transcription elongation factor TFIIS [Chlorella vulgaris]
MAVTAAELGKLVETVLTAVKKADDGDSAEQQRAVDGLKLLKKQRVNTKVLGATQAGKRIKALAKHSRPDVAAAATAVIAAWKDAVRQEAADNTAAIAGDGKAAASTAGGPASSRQTAPSSSGPGDGGGGTQPGSQQTVDAAAPAQLPPALDPEAVPRSGDSVRDKCRQHLASAFQLAVMEGVAGDPVMAAVAVENEIFNQNNGVSQAYKAKFRNLHFNLKDAGNPDLRRKVLSGDIAPDVVVVLAPEELASDAKRNENARIREKKLFDSAPAAMKQATTDQFQCGKCRQRKTTYYQMQTRSADEPMTTLGAKSCHPHIGFPRACTEVMGNSHPQPGSNEFAAEFHRIEAAISCEEAKFELQRDTESLRQLHLQLIDMKIACAKYWCTETCALVEWHRHAAKRGCCFNVSLESQRAVAWRLTQEAFYHQLLALLEEEKSALLQRCPAMEVPLPTLEASPEPLPVGDDICGLCTVYLGRRRWEPQLRCGQDGSVQDFKWLPHTGVPWVAELGPGTPPAGLEAARPPFTGIDAATSPGMAQAEEVHPAAAQAGGGQAADASSAASTDALSAFSASVDAGATHSPDASAENKSLGAREHQAELQAHQMARLHCLSWGSGGA